MQRAEAAKTPDGHQCSRHYGRVEQKDDVSAEQFGRSPLQPGYGAFYQNRRRIDLGVEQQDTDFVYSQQGQGEEQAGRERSADVEVPPLLEEKFLFQFLLATGLGGLLVVSLRVVLFAPEPGHIASSRSITNRQSTIFNE